jgi:mannose-1-phosphate guanylyltransferase
MPVHGIPLLEYWIRALIDLGFESITVNTHYHAQIVEDFLSRKIFGSLVRLAHEDELLGTAGTIRANAKNLSGDPLLVVHADNWCQCNIKAFINSHERVCSESSLDIALTMMTFQTRNPERCGIVELDQNGLVTKFYEKCSNPPGNLANAAVYLMRSEVISWIGENPQVKDISTDVLQHFMGRIATWHNNGIHVDIGTIETLRDAQKKGQPIPKVLDDWTVNFNQSSVRRFLKTWGL